MAFTTDTSKGGYQGKPNSNFIPREEWNKLSQDQKDQLIAKRRQERMKQNGGNWKSNQPRRQVNVHDVNDLVHVDTLIDYAIMNRDVVPPTFTEETTLMNHPPLMLIHRLHTWQAAVQEELLVIFEMFLLLNVNLIRRVKVAQQTKVKQFQVLLR
jgi:hypothetical protein